MLYEKYSASNEMMYALSLLVKADIVVISDLTDKLPYFRKLKNLISLSDRSNIFRTWHRETLTLIFYAC